MTELKVSDADVKIRLDKFLTKYAKDSSRSKIQNWIEGGRVSVNSVFVLDSSYRTKFGDVVTFDDEYSEPELTINPEADVPFEILFEDSDILVVNKPAGVVVHPGAGNYQHTLANGLAYHCGENLSQVNTALRPGIVHRIDKDTSGILVVAKNDYAHAKLAKQFEEHSITRKYVCFIFGNLRPANGVIKTLLARDSRNRLKISVSEGRGKTAITIYKTLRTFSTFAAKVECELKTGRTHQIRAHLSSLGHSLIGDSLYKVKNYSLPKDIADEINHFPRQALHACVLEFVHPRTEQILKFYEEMPSDMRHLESVLESGVTKSE